MSASETTETIEQKSDLLGRSSTKLLFGGYGLFLLILGSCLFFLFSREFSLAEKSYELELPVKGDKVVIEDVSFGCFGCRS